MRVTREAAIATRELAESIGLQKYGEPTNRRVSLDKPLTDEQLLGLSEYYNAEVSQVTFGRAGHEPRIVLSVGDSPTRVYDAPALFGETASDAVHTHPPIYANDKRNIETFPGLQEPSTSDLARATELNSTIRIIYRRSPNDRTIGTTVVRPGG